MAIVNFVNFGFPIGKICAPRFPNLPSARMIVESASQLGTAVRAVRRAAGLRQRDLAALAGVGERFIVELEAGKPTIRLGKTLLVIAALGHRLSIEAEP